MKTFADLFTGAGGAATGAALAGMKTIWGVELVDDFAAIARLNGHPVITADVNEFVYSEDYAQLQRPDWLHCSPPCVTASLLNVGAVETEADRSMAQSIVACLDSQRPDFFSLENVKEYRRYDSYRYIVEALKDKGYKATEAVLNASGFGIPQSRERLFLVASRVKDPGLPSNSHDTAGNGQLPMFGSRVVGWGEVIRGAAMSAPYKLSARMEEMVPKDFHGQALMSGWQMTTNFRDGGLTIRRPSEPAPTILAKATQPSCRPIIITRLRTGKIFARVLSLEAIAALQSFPDNYDWGLSDATALRTIGNAVPPKLMAKIIEANL